MYKVNRIAIFGTDM